MLASQELAFADFGHLAPEVPKFLSSKSQIPTKKILLVLGLLFLFAIVGPRKSASETHLSSATLLQASNQNRTEAGLAPLLLNPLLEKAALAKARDILTADYFAHVSPAGTAPWDFIKNEGFAYAFAGENLAIGYSSAYELTSDFLGSPSHRENLLSPLFSEVGIAVLSGDYRGQETLVTVQMFAAPLHK